MIYRYKEVQGKIVDEITVTNDPDSRCISIRFSDRTAMHFTLTPQIHLKPELMDWSTGDGRELKRFRAMKESL